MIGGDFMRRIRTVNYMPKLKNNQGEIYTYPRIMLQGKCVANLGFRPGDKVLICGKTGLIVVKLIKPE